MRTLRVMVLVGLVVCGTWYVFQRGSDGEPTGDVTHTAAKSTDRSARRIGVGAVDDSSAAPVERSFEAMLGEAWAGGNGEAAVLAVVSGHGLDAPEPALREILRHPGGHLRNQALLTLVRLWADQDPVAAASAVLGEVPQEDLDRLLGQVVAVWSGTSPGDCLAWINARVSNPATRDLLMRQVYSVWAANEPNEALESVLTGGAPEAHLNVVFAAVGDQDFAQAMDLYHSLEPDRRRSVQETLILVAAGGEAPDARALIRDFVDSHPAEDDQARLGRNLAGMHRGMALELIDAAGSEARKQVLLDRMFPGGVTGFAVGHAAGDSDGSGRPDGGRPVEMSDTIEVPAGRDQPLGKQITR